MQNIDQYLNGLNECALRELGALESTTAAQVKQQAVMQQEAEKLQQLDFKLDGMLSGIIQELNKKIAGMEGQVSKFEAQFARLAQATADAQAGRRSGAQRPQAADQLLDL